MTTTNYSSPEIQLLDFGSVQMICTSGNTDAPGKDQGYFWDDDKY